LKNLKKSLNSSNAQLYRFRISENPRRISSLGVEWEGHREPYSACKTETWIWNFSKGEWEQLSSKKGTVSDVWLTEEVEMDAQNYVSGGYVYVLARAERYTPEDFSLAVSPASATVTGYVKDASTGSGISITMLKLVWR